GRVSLCRRMVLGDDLEQIGQRFGVAIKANRVQCRKSHAEILILERRANDLPRLGKVDARGRPNGVAAKRGMFFDKHTEIQPANRSFATPSNLLNGSVTNSESMIVKKRKEGGSIRKFLLRQFQAARIVDGLRVLLANAINRPLDLGPGNLRGRAADAE